LPCLSGGKKDALHNGRWWPVTANGLYHLSGIQTRWSSS
jgi:hypothetical protein